MSIKIDKKISKYRVEKPEDKKAAVVAKEEPRKEANVVWMHEKLERPEDQDARGPVEADTATPRNTPEDDMRRHDRRPDDQSARAKNSGHGKKTADQWNQ